MIPKKGLNKQGQTDQKQLNDIYEPQPPSQLMKHDGTTSKMEKDISQLRWLSLPLGWG